MSYGLVLLSEPGQILLAHATGTSHWDVPKGGADPGETALDAVCREVREETGLTVEPSTLRDLGELDYRADKRLHLFALRVEAQDVEPADCVCRSFFDHPKSGRPTPEVDRFAWVPFEDIPRYSAKNLTRVLTQTLPLTALLKSLPVHRIRQSPR